MLQQNAEQVCFSMECELQGGGALDLAKHFNAKKEEPKISRLPRLRNQG
jgi:hypothetical protein